MWGDQDLEEVVEVVLLGGGGPGNGAVVLGGGWGSSPAIRGPAAMEGTRRLHGRPLPNLQDSHLRTVSGGWSRDVRKGLAGRAPRLLRGAQFPLNLCKGCKGVPGDRPFPVYAIWPACSGTTPVTRKSKSGSYAWVCGIKSRRLRHHSTWRQR